MTFAQHDIGMQQIVTEGHDGSDWDDGHGSACNHKSYSDESCYLMTVLKLFSNARHAVMEEKGEDKVGEDVSKVIEIKHSVACGRCKCLYLAILYYDDDCSYNHEWDGDESNSDDDNLQNFSFIDAFEWEGGSWEEEYSKPELESV